jgi:hypothetical protein
MGIPLRDCAARDSTRGDSLPSHSRALTREGLLVKNPVLFSILSRYERVYLHNFVKLSNIKFRGNPFRGSRVVTCGQTDIATLTGAHFCNF